MREIRKIRVVIELINQDDKRNLVRALRMPGICTKEIWCKRLNEAAFQIKEIT